MFSPGAGFYRESEKNYKGYGSFKYKGRVLDPGVIYNFSNFRDYDWKKNFLFNFVFVILGIDLLE